jgi:hypothetical protein
MAVLKEQHTKAALPGEDFVAEGLRDLAEGKESIPALLVSIGAPRLQRLGIRVWKPFPNPERRLYQSLTVAFGDGAHSQYNALIRRLVSYERARECGLE